MLAMPSWSERVAEALAKPRHVPSPCISVCTMNPASELCNGCWRTLDEIAAWSTLSDAEKRTVWLRIATRAAGPVHDHGAPP